MSKKERTLKRTYNRNVKKIVKSESGMMIQSLKLENVELIGKLRIFRTAFFAALVVWVGTVAVSFYIIRLLLEGF